MPKLNRQIVIIAAFLLWLPQVCHAVKSIKTVEHVIVLDPGHGGKDTGLVSPSGKSEKELTFTLARQVAAMLDARYTVHLTRPEDLSLSLTERVSLANQKQADLFISIHLNRSKTGAAVFYFSPGTPQALSENSWETAGLKYRQQSQNTCTLFKKIFTQHHIPVSSAKSDIPVTPLEGALMPAILVEPFSMSQFPFDPEKQASFLEQYAKILVQCIDRYCGR